MRLKKVRAGTDFWHHLVAQGYADLAAHYSHLGALKTDWCLSPPPQKQSRTSKGNSSSSSNFLKLPGEHHPGGWCSPSRSLTDEDAETRLAPCGPPDSTASSLHCYLFLVYRIRRSVMWVWLSRGEVLLVEVLFARFLHPEVSVFPFVINTYFVGNPSDYVNSSFQIRFSPPSFSIFWFCHSILPSVFLSWYFIIKKSFLLSPVCVYWCGLMDSYSFLPLFILMLITVMGGPTCCCFPLILWERLYFLVQQDVACSFPAQHSIGHFSKEPCFF